MAYDPFEGFRKKAEVTPYSPPDGQMPYRPFDRTKAEPWVLGTEMGPPKELANTVGPPTDEDRARWAQAQQASAQAKPAPDPLNKFLVQSAQAFLPGSAAFAVMPEGEKQRQMSIAGQYPLEPPSTVSTGVASPFTDSAVREPPSQLEAAPPAVTPPLTSIGGGFGVTGAANTSGRPGFSSRTYYDPNGNAVASGVTSAQGRGGFVGASTDVQAAKALQDRLEQDAAAHAAAVGMDRAGAAMRDLRDAQIADFDGFRRGAPEVPGPSASNNPFSLPGDSFQDTRGRQADFERLRDQAVSGNRRQRSEAAIGLNSLMGLLERNQAREQIAADARTGQARLADERLRMLLGQQEHAVDNARADRSVALQEKQFQAAQEQNQFNREHTAAQFLQSERKDRTQLGQDEVKRVEDTYAKFAAETKNAVNPAQLMDFGRSLLGRSNLNAMSPEMAQRIRDGSPTLEDLHRLRSLQASSNDYWFFRPTEQDVVNKYYKQ